MNLKGKLPLVIVAALAWVVIVSSCANMGMPVGGPRDTVPPVLVGTDPNYGILNFKGKSVKLTFNEYLQTDEISETLVISPPLEKRPLIKTKSKTLIIQFNEELKDSATYSLDFKNSIVDNNEKNPLENLRFTFSTGDVLDSLRVAGRVMNAFNLEPIGKGLVLLHSNLHDSAVFRVRPDYIAKTDIEGMFMMDNIAPGKYHIFALNDLNGDLLYNEGAEEIAFIDSLVIPSVEFHPLNDPIDNEVDSMLVTGHTHFYPDPFYLRFFLEDIYEQYMESANREGRNKCLFLFNESVKDSFNVELLNAESDNWKLFEYNQKADSIVLWITDTLVSKQDSLFMELSYFQLDSAGEKYVQKDTMLMKYTEPKVDDKKKRRGREKEEDEPEPIPQFNWESNLSSTMELNGAIKITAPEPIAFFDSTLILLHLSSDTLKTPLDFTFEKETSTYRTYIISYDWVPQEEYSFLIDSAACTNIYGITSREFSKSIKVREEDYYGSITFNFSNVEMPMLVQVLKNNDNEDIIRQLAFNEDGPVTFEYLTPEKYKIKIIYDENGNGKWDPGSYQDNYQPEMVTYMPEVIKLRSNWSENYNWDVTPDLTFTKNILDQELEIQKRKEAEEKARKEKEAEQKNSMFKPGDSSSGSSIQQN
ncbi:Ig-like domain-containing protein [Prolixibacteraceae bacterium Z1-6]|uniref:Ig-like domain-containing protein n=1 Tax=Draconibacterium aestuarii TaxID=2998507 RepID=A0A9X3F5B8_9BACT|nr:Ig-like domain-containing protein [Prolixibacteraceae bacterium Z1-6]